MKKITLVITLLLILTNSLAFAGAWTQKKYSGYFQLGTQFLSAKKAYDENGDKYAIPNFNDLTVNLYGEFGLSNNVTAIANLPFYRSLKQEAQIPGSDDISKTGISDAHLGLKIKLAEFNQNVVSITGLLGVPLGERNDSTGLWTGSEEWNQILMINFGRSFYPLDIYFSSLLGYNNRVNGFSDEVRFSIEGGYFVIPNKLLVILKVNGVSSLKNGSLANVGGAAGLYANNQSFIAYGPEVHYSLSKNIGIIGRVESGAMVKNAPSALAFSFGVFLKN
ncbi:MAG: hypothetical protein HND52_07890 [Ignavibacteriae bacterium]|nr:hypothetical protein [Ignavibacteriota bacterium]NOG97868.1 hypothetical protein [Ignavibacteriota bacterium]